jgi:hypothetical protein
MRTTITLDDDVAAELTELRNREQRGFKDVVNEALRAGLLAMQTPGRQPSPPERFTMPVRLGAAPDVSDVSAVLAELDEADWRRKLGLPGGAAT